MNRPALKFYGDSDGDGVMNGFDCAPNNSRKQGPQHKHNKPMWPFEKKERAEQRKILSIEQLKKKYPGENYFNPAMDADEQQKEYDELIREKYNKQVRAYKNKAEKAKSNEIQPSWSDFEKAGISVNEGPTWDERKAMREKEADLDYDKRRVKAEQEWIKKGKPEPEYDYEEAINKAEGRAEKEALKRHEDDDDIVHETNTPLSNKEKQDWNRPIEKKIYELKEAERKKIKDPVAEEYAEEEEFEKEKAAWKKARDYNEED